MSSTVLQDNPLLRALCSMPTARPSTSTALAVPQLPPRKCITGDEQIDAVLWLREVISTGQRPMIAKAMEAAKLIATPLEELGKRYTAHVHRSSNGHFGEVLRTFGFSDLKGLADASIQKFERQQEAIARFGSVDQLLAETPAEKKCKKALIGLRRTGQFNEYNSEHVAGRFMQTEALMPMTLSDCVFVQQYWDDLYRLRYAVVSDAGDHLPQAQAHDDFAFTLMQHVMPRTSAEALKVLHHMIAEEKMDRNESVAILRNLIGGRQ